MRIVLGAIFSILTQIIVAQSDTAMVSYASDTMTPKASVKIIADGRISKLLEIKKSNALNSPGLPGYRIQLYYGPRTEALEYQAEFLKLFPEIPCYMIYDAPNFKVRVGDFRGRYEARRMHLGLKEDFPDSFILKDQINLPDFPEF